MGMSLECEDETGPYPRLSELVLTCDGERHILIQHVERFSHRHGYFGTYHMAIKRGWKESYRKGQPVWLGPCCSGKKV